jgi:hypothetical protein
MHRMRRTLAAAAVVVAATLLPARDTCAQAPPAWEGRALLSVGVGGQATSTTFAESVEFRRFAEGGTFDTDYDVGAGPSFDVGFAVRLWRALGVGVSVSSFTRADAVQVTARVPHPFFFERHRVFAADVEDVERRDVGVHVQAIFLIPAGERLRLMLSGGPSIVRLQQDFVSGVAFTEMFPFDDLVGPRATVVTRDESAVGFNVGTDLTWMAGRRWGLGGLFRYSRGTVDFTVPNDLVGDRDLSIDAGGFNVTGGLRVFF